MQYFVDFSFTFCYNIVNKNKTEVKSISRKPDKRKIKKRIGSVFLALFVLFSALHFIFSHAARGPGYELEIIFFDVGQGDAALIRCPDGYALIDAGPDTAEEELIYALKARGVKKISLFFLSHSDSDHAGGADRIIREFDVSCVYVPDRSAKLDSVKDAARERDCDIVQCAQGDVFIIGEAEFRIMSPIPPLSGNENSDSLVIRMNYKNASALFMGDADVAAEEKMISYYGELPRCDLVKLGHHGAQTSSSEAFIEAISPQYALISCGRGNSYGHPHAKVLTRLKRAGVSVFRTDISGEIVFAYDGIRLIPLK